jgi:hypothetical protein
MRRFASAFTLSLWVMTVSAETAATQPGNTVADQMDHGQMDHSQMEDHSQMDHSQMDHSQMDHGQMGHGQMGHGEHGMIMDSAGMVMGHNDDKLPGDCTAISEDVVIEVHVGRKYATPGRMFGFSEHQWHAAPCARVIVTLVNEDDVRHQWMIHGLPRYLYDQGMFHLEAEGRQQKTGAFIVPGENMTYLVHCDMSQHTEKGLKAQLTVGRGSGDLPSIPGLTEPRYGDRETFP